MARRKIIILILLVVLVLGSCCPIIAYAAPYNTLTKGVNGQMVATQTAYEPVGKLSPVTSPLSNPQDMQYNADTQLVYVADTGNSRVVAISLEGDIVQEIGVGILSQPYGIDVSNDIIYVADKQEKKVFCFSQDTAQLLQEISKPTDVAYTSDTFVPIKVRADVRGNIYVVSQGSVNGCIQLSSEGGFMANIGVNETPVSFSTIFKEIFYSDEQISAFLAIPRSPTNIAMDSKGLLYTVTEGASVDAIKKLNAAGTAIMSPEDVNDGLTTAICIDADGNIYSVDSLGYVSVHDSYGNILFRFGGQSDLERLGVLSNAVAVAITEEGMLLVLDANYCMVIMYSPTQFADLVFEATALYNDGLYIDAQPLWEEVLQYNSNFILAYSALGSANMKLGNYQLALEQFEIAENKQGYSEAFWEVRDAWLQDNFGTVAIVVMILIVLIMAYKIIDKRLPNTFVKLKSGSAKVAQLPVVSDIAHIKKMLHSPSEGVYEIKYHNAAGVLGATVLYVGFVAIQILAVVIKGYLFSNVNVYTANAVQIVLVSTLPLLLFVICNYFVSNVTEGEGKLVHCYIAFIYGLAPYFVMSIPIFLVSNILTYNEQIIYTILCIIMYGWSAYSLFATIGELHDFTFGQTIKNILLTIFTALMVVLLVIVVWLLANQMIGYFDQLIWEMFI